MTATDVGLMPLVMQLGRARASAMDVPVALASLCGAVSAAVGVAGAVILLAEPLEGVPTLTASDARAGWIGEIQQRAGGGPLGGALRTWQSMLTADMARIGPPAVAAAAAECGLVSSLVMPFEVNGERVGVLQLLGDAQRPVEPAHADILQPLLDVLAARLADVRALRLAKTARPMSTPQAAREADAAAPARKSRSRRGAHAIRDDADPCEETTHALPAIGAARSAARPPAGQRRKGRHSA